jgi:uncharacterized membrane protein
MSVRSVVPEPKNPILVKHRQMRRASLQNRIADAVTKFAGSMAFVYVHIVWFSLWIGFRVEKFPFGLLTMIVSLEAIFLSTFILISSNRQDERRQMLADHEWQLVQRQETQNQEELQQNKELIRLSNEILRLTKAVHELTVSRSGPGSGATGG